MSELLSEEELTHKLADLIAAYNFTHKESSLTDIGKIEKSNAMHAIISQIQSQKLAWADHVIGEDVPPPGLTTYYDNIQRDEMIREERNLLRAEQRERNKL